MLDLRIKQAVLEIAPNTAYSARLSQCSHTHHFRDVAVALRSDLADGYGESIHTLAHGEVFTDMLDQAQHLFDEGYLVQAAVTAGIAGETHLKRLALKSGLPIVDPLGKPFRAASINDALAKQGIYKKTMHKHVMAWQGIRNDAAHSGTTGHLSRSLVKGQIDGLRRFMADYPA